MCLVNNVIYTSILHKNIMARTEIKKFSQTQAEHFSHTVTKKNISNCWLITVLFSPTFVISQLNYFWNMSLFTNVTNVLCCISEHQCMNQYMISWLWLKKQMPSYLSCNQANFCFAALSEGVQITLCLKKTSHLWLAIILTYTTRLW